MKALILTIILSCVCPARVVCPIDGTVVGFTGRSRVVQGETQCEYRHVWIHFRNSVMVDEPHVMWVPCEVK